MIGSRLLYALIVGAVIAAALALRIWDPSPVARLRALVFDSYPQISPRQNDPGLPLRVVDIDDESLNRIGQWPWPRTVLAELVKKLSDNGAVAVGFDMVFPEPDRMSPANALRLWPQSDELAGLRAEVEKLPSNDQVLAEAIGQGAVVLGFIATPHGGTIPQSKAGFAHGGDDPRLFAPSYPGAAASLAELQDKAAGSGSLNWLPEHDQIIRRVPMVVQVDGKLFPSFAADMLRLAQGASTYMVKSSGASSEKAFGENTGIVKMRVGDYEVPTEADGEMWIRFARQAKERYLPAWKVLNGDIGKEEIEGRLAIIGTSAAGLLDLRATPLEASVPGVERDHGPRVPCDRGLVVAVEPFGDRRVPRNRLHSRGTPHLLVRGAGRCTPRFFTGHGGRALRARRAVRLRSRGSGRDDGGRRVAARRRSGVHRAAGTPAGRLTLRAPEVLRRARIPVSG